MPELSVGNKSIEVDKEGFLKNLDDWNCDVARALALAEEIELTGEHWLVINSVRDFYDRYQLSPAMRPLVKFLKHRMGADRVDSIFLMRLFPGSSAKLVSKIAGLPKPSNCT